MKFYSILLISILFASYAYAQKIGIEEISKNKIDSLRSEEPLQT